MANSTFFLTQPAAQRIGTKEIFIEKIIDFALLNTAAGNSVDALNLPKGAIITHFGMKTVTINTTDALLKLQITVPGVAQELRAAAVLGAAGTFVMVPTTAGVLLTADDVIRVVASVKTAKEAKIYIFVKYVVSDLYRN